MSNTKEKAKELFDRFLFSSIYFTNGIEGAKLNAKQCALVVVDELQYYTEDARFFEYLEEVKQEIQNL